MPGKVTRTATRTAVKTAAAAADVLRRPPAGLVVLIYHRVGRRTDTEVDLPRACFEDQIAWLAATLPVVSLDDGLAWVAGDDGARTREIRVAVTFDDGTADFVDEALPVLERFGVPATLYVATAFVEEQRAFPNDGVPLSWAALRAALDTGVVTVGSHTHTHALLDRLPDDAVADELDRSTGLIGDRLGVVASHFAYPKAVMGSAAADRAVRARFVSGALAGGRANRPGRTDAFRLARTPVQVSDGEAWFRRKAGGGLALEETLRSVANRRRYSNVTS
ncbi:MAG: polysaccharide deacetylase family protein [Actinomycetota bacterium]